MNKNNFTFSKFKSLFVLLNLILLTELGTTYIHDYISNTPIPSLSNFNEQNIEFKLITIGFISGLIGAIGHFIGQIIEDVIPGNDSLIKRFPNDFFRILFWVTTTIYTYILLIHDNKINRLVG